jgi:arylsulfatase A-like enzyme
VGIENREPRIENEGAADWDNVMAEMPNVLVIMCDQMKATASHLWGSSFCETPSMERLAGTGVRFEYCVTPHPLCVPARISFWTSQWPHTHGGRRNETLMPADAPHVFKLWKDAGYHTGLIGKNHCFEAPEDIERFDTYCEITHGGIPKGAPENRGMAWFRSREQIDAGHTARRNMPNVSPHFSYAITDHPLEDYSTGLVAGQTVRFLEAHKDESFALWVSIPDPHGPYEVPRQYAEMFGPDVVALPPRREDEFSDGSAPERNRVVDEMIGLDDDPEEEIRAVVGVYHAMVRFLDDAVGQILDALEANGLRENTIVVFCSDHGDYAGEHHTMGKGGTFYDCLTRVPLIVSWPGQVPEGVTDSSMANLVDVVPTLLDLQGLEIPRSMNGQPLPTVTTASARDATFSEYGAGGQPFTMRDLEKMKKPYGRRAIGASLQWREAEGRRKMVRTANWKYVHDSMMGPSEDELYDLVNDPWELRNVVADPGNREILAEMQLQLADWSIRTEDPRSVPLPE